MRSYTSRLVNHVEPYLIGGYTKTAFFSEVNTNVVIGDRVFLLNGNYDSNELVKKDRYGKGVDGYRILFVDRCKIVLDIDYTSILPHVDSNNDDFVQIHHVRSQREFEYYNKINITHSSGIISKFSLLKGRSVLYSDSGYSRTQDSVFPGGNLPSKGFFVKDDNNEWLDITSNFINGTLDSVVGILHGTRIYIVGEDISYLGAIYKQRTVYIYEDGKWIIDIKYKQTIISKLNFRDGNFNGNFNDGIYGTYLKSLNWIGDVSNWNSGFLVNSNWINGVLNSKSLLSDQSYYSKLEKGLIVQTTDFSNNKGFGYNYILDSDVLSGSLLNGNYYNSVIGVTSSTYKSIDIHYSGIDTFTLHTSGGFYNFCDVKSISMANSVILDCIVSNSIMKNTKMINSQMNHSVGDGSDFDSSNGLRVLGADLQLYTIVNMGTSNDYKRGLVKLYISDEDYNRLDNFDNLFIKKINKEYVLTSLTDDQKILLPFENRYILDSFFNSELGKDEIVVSIKSKKDNTYSHGLLDSDNILITFDGFENAESHSNYLTQSVGLQVSASVDIDFSINTLINNPIITNNTNQLFIGTNINNSDFNSGLLTNSNWLSGVNINNPEDIITLVSPGTGRLNISKDLGFVNSISVTVGNTNLIPGDFVWLESIDAIDSGTFSISGRYIVDNISTSVIISTSVGIPNKVLKVLKLTELDTNNIPGLSMDAQFLVSGVTSSYVSVNKFFIEKSVVKSGLFKRTGFNDTKFDNILFDNNDKDLKIVNTDILRLVNIIFKDNKLVVNNGLIYKSHIIDPIWNGGIAYNSVWNGGTFGGGVFKSGYWKDGVFTNGLFTSSLDQFVTNGPTASADYFIGTNLKNWNKGTFNGGIFEGSIWTDGTFNNGKFYNASFDYGNWYNGILGDKNISTDKTTFGTKSGSVLTWHDGIVDNALIGGDGIVTWNNGVFNNGIFTSTPNSGSSTWLNGVFNGGDFIKAANWLNGTFNNGNFKAYIYPWSNGKFNGGIFGVGASNENSVWDNGEFNGGLFKGKVWNNGIFSNGKFVGSGDSINGDENKFVSSFGSSYYGLWMSGYVLDRKDLGKPEEKITSELSRVVDEKNKVISATFENVLWMGGTFSHGYGVMHNCIWLNGSFKKGNFINSSFNPYVYRTLSDPLVLSFTYSNCVWEDGYFDNGNFYISEWKSGIFNSGTMTGGIWRNGVWRNGYAKNIYWENGTWENGTWNGTPFDSLDISTTSNTVIGMAKEVILWVNQYNLPTANNTPNNIKGDFILSTDWINDPNNDNNIYFKTIYSYCIFVSNTTDVTRIVTYNGINNMNINTEYSITYTIYNVDNTEFNIRVGGNDGEIRNSDGVYNERIRIGTDRSIILVAKSTSNTANLFINNIIISPIINNDIHIMNHFENGRGNLSNVLEDVNISNYRSYSPVNNGIDSIYWDRTSWRTKLQISGQNWFTDPGYHTTIDGKDVWVNDRHIVIGLDDSDTNILYAVLPTGYSNGVTDVIFEFGYTYDIELRIGVLGDSTWASPSDTDPSTSNSDTCKLRVITNLGTSSTVRILESQSRLDGFRTKVSTIKFSYNPSIYDIDTTGWDKLSINRDRLGVGISGGRMVLLDGKVIKTRNIVYGKYNNKLFKGIIGDVSNLDTSSVSIPSYSTLTAIPDVYNNNNFAYGTDNFNYHKKTNSLVSMNCGNGTFKSGKWVNGTWKNGWRSNWGDSPFDKSDSKFDVSSIIKVSPYRWNIKLLPQIIKDLEDFKIGNKVSVGNLAMVTHNESRLPIKDSMIVVSIIDNNSLTLEFVTTQSGVRDIKKDSDIHDILVSKNIWLNGTFLNGYFKGIWNNGTFDGNVNTSKMEDSIWIDGIFNGGHFKTDRVTLASTGTYSLNGFSSGLMQNVRFSDGNVGDTSVLKYDFLSTGRLTWPYDKINLSIDPYFSRMNLKYNSWIDVVYYNSSMTNIGEEHTTYNFPLDVGTKKTPIPIEYTPIQINGFPTRDVLSSVSSFRKLSDNTIGTYQLGSKYNIYNDFIGNSTFNKSIFTGVADRSPGDSKFILDGWTYSTISGTATYRSNYHGFENVFDKEIDNNNQLYINGGTDSLYLESYSLLNNIKTLDIEEHRYSMIEYEIGRNFGLNNNKISYPNYLDKGGEVLLLNSPNLLSLNKSIIDHNSTNENVKREFFYNRQSLSIVNYVLGSAPDIPIPYSMDYSFKYINFLEVDMVPFFQYVTESHIDSTIRLLK
jgi:hypothetical protein